MVILLSTRGTAGSDIWFMYLICAGEGSSLDGQDESVLGETSTKGNESRKRKAKLEVASSSSGKFVVQEMVPPKKRNLTIPDGGTLYEVKESGGSTTIEVLASKSKKMKEVISYEEEDSRPKLNAKQRRRLEREARQKKTGTHFYETANVKNRRRR
uniref:Uncharacterized protein n=1 Tax=Pinctada fucata TaxID=50426 RepID=A0A194AMB3_PINFU